MKTKTWEFVDKSGWGPGPWQDEPDKVQWEDPETGLPCLVRRSPFGGNWCGYVAIPPGHLWYGDAGELPVSVHGGLTFAGFCDDDKEHGICHIPEEGEPDPAFWVGFDCGHAYDVMPAMEARECRNYGWPALRFGDEEYRTLEYIQEQCALLAAQVKASY